MNYQYQRTGAFSYKARRAVEKVMRKPLPPNAEVHHVDGNPVLKDQN